METIKVGMREFRENLASYALQGSAPVAITRHGDTVGLFIPTRPRPTKEQWAAFQARAEQFHEDMRKAGVTEDELIEDFKRARKAEHR